MSLGHVLNDPNLSLKYVFSLLDSGHAFFTKVCQMWSLSSMHDINSP